MSPPMERESSITIPRSLSEFWKDHADSLTTIRCSKTTGAGICLSASDVDDLHGAAIEASLCVDEQPPAGLKKFITIGSDGGGGFYFIRRNGSLRVWMLDSDWYSSPKLVSKSIRQFTRQLLRSEFPDRNLQWWKFWIE